MNFAIFDDDFALEKANYIKEIKKLEKQAISDEYKLEWKDFVKIHLTDTRNFYLLQTALKIINNLKEKLDYDTAVFSSLSFMPDQTFLETTIMLVVRFSNFENDFAKHFNVDVTSILKAKKEYKNKQKESKETKNKTFSEVKPQIIKAEKKLISLKSKKLVPVEFHLKNITKKNKK